MLASYHRAMKEARQRPPRQEFVVSCPECGEVIGLRFGGERVPDLIHECADEEDRRGGGTPAAS